MNLPLDQANTLNLDSLNIVITQFMNLRVLVLSLGESHNFGWWKSQFLSPTGFSFLDRIFPRTKVASAIRSASYVAQISHDISIGRGEVIHLFRIPLMEEAIDDELSNDRIQLLQNIFAMHNNKDELLQLLSNMTNGITWSKQFGPIRLSNSQWTDIHLLASIYFQGFINKTPVYPYLVD